MAAILPQIVFGEKPSLRQTARRAIEGWRARKKRYASDLYQRVGRFDFYHTPVKPYFFWYAQSPLFVRQLENSLQGVDQPFVTKTRLMGMVVPFLPLPEQRRIVAEVERRLSVVAALERAVEAWLARARRLRQAVLKRAFEGRLVAQDPEDEPAAVLLERIRATREARAAGGKKRKTRQMRLPEM
jgi:type I restriction enzyme S subunit